MNICVVTPAPARSRHGNRVTALRWVRILRDLGHRVALQETYDRRRYDLMVALHARRSFSSVERFVCEHPDRPLILALTGTDLYRDIHTDTSAQQSLEIASRFIVLQPLGIHELPAHLRDKARVIYQSVKPLGGAFPHRKRVFEVCVIGHLRPVKDPFRTAMAARLLPYTSRIEVIHVGGALTRDMENRAQAEAAGNPRYHWLGELPRWKARRVLARSRLLILTSHMEGGANVISEAIAASVPIISSRIPGSIGLLGADYPGFFPVRDTQALASLLTRTETDADFYLSLKTLCRRLAPLVDMRRERASWASLLHELAL